MTPRRPQTPQAFKASLDSLVQAEARRTGRRQSSLRTLLVMERLLARIFAVAPDAFTLKGGLALELRLQNARTTRDIDLRAMGSPRNLETLLAQAARLRLTPEDWLEFRIQADADHPDITAEWMIYDGTRYRVEALLAGRPYGDPFGLNVAFSDPMVTPPDHLLGTPMLERYGFERLSIPIYPVATHLAEKLHAYTVPRDRENSRLKDLVDMALLSELTTLESSALRAAVNQTFSHRATHPVPSRLPDPPHPWRARYLKLQREDRLRWPTLDDVLARARALMEPPLRGLEGRWLPQSSTWEPTS